MRNSALRTAAIIGALVLPCTLPAQELQFRRGDVNGDSAFDLSDGIMSLLYLFVGDDVGCLKAADSNDNGTIDLTDAIYVFNHLFLGGPQPAAPGPNECGLDPTPDTLTCETSDSCDQPPPVNSDLRLAGHLVNRIGYGPTKELLDHVQTVGLSAYIDEQLDPASIDEADNTALNSRLDDLFEVRQPAVDTRLVESGSVWRYHKGTEAPPADWYRDTFDATVWERGATGFGYGDGDDLTVFDDMRRISDDPETPDYDESQPGYTTVFIRTSFNVDDPSAIERLVLSVDYDDGFIAYLNGRLILRVNAPSSISHLGTASSTHEAGEPEEFDVTSRISFLEEGENILAFQGFNASLTSSDFSLNPELIERVPLPGDPIESIGGIDELQRLVHVRGVYSDRQLQAVLAEFWENHFTTDYDKLAEYFDNLQNSDATDAMSGDQAELEAAQVEFEEYEFYYENGLGYFGDLLLYSATSVSMNVYLDNVLSVKGNANENYSREILELSAFGVDNRYTQQDIEELAESFTGWNICKVLTEDLQGFPDSARNPPLECGVQFEDTVFMDLGPGWKYFKGTEEPTPDAEGDPTTAWAEVDYDDSTWLDGSTGIGYGDGDDATVLDDMRDNYYSVYLRKEFTVEDPFTSIKNLILEVQYDDGFVAYVNGVEVGRSETMEDEGEPPAFDDDADDGHEVDEGIEYYGLNRVRGLLNPAPAKNILAIQVHNTSRGSSDLSMLPRLLDREILPGSVENGAENGHWVFRFDYENHDNSSKTIFQNTPYQIRILERGAEVFGTEQRGGQRALLDAEAEDGLGAVARAHHREGFLAGDPREPRRDRHEAARRLQHAVEREVVGELRRRGVGRVDLR
ncbi:MAG: DUF1800 family protein, partial [Planctomycetota bacterium]